MYTEQNHLMQPSPYRGQPSPEVEEAWIKLWRCKEFPHISLKNDRMTLTELSTNLVPMIQFPESKLPALNKTDATQYMHASQDYGGGVLGFLHVFHELHCLVRPSPRPSTTRCRVRADASAEHHSTVHVPSDLRLQQCYGISCTGRGSSRPRRPLH